LTSHRAATAPKAKKRKTEQPEEVNDEEVEGEDDAEVDGKDLEDDEEDAGGEEDADEDVSFLPCLAVIRSPYEE